MSTILKNGIIVTENEILKDYDMEISENIIKRIGKKLEVEEDAVVVDCEGKYILPGFIDIHSDMIENLIQPRSTALMGIDIGLHEAEPILAACGITTMFHSISMYREGSWDSKVIRQAPMVRELAEKIKGRSAAQSRIHNKFHLRYELDNIECYSEVKKLIEEGKVDLFSYMDHSPGQGQYRDLSIYRKHLPGEGKNLTDEEFKALVEREQRKPKVEGEQLEALIARAREQKISIASHDDESVERVEKNRGLKVDISEFPITMEAAKKAVEYQMLTVLGAPNVVLGGSHSGNLSAIDAVKEDAVKILVSDYYPQSLLLAVFKLYKSGLLPLHEAVKLVTANPARATGIYSETGSLQQGKQADVLVVAEVEEIPFVERVFVSGKKVMESHTQQ